MIHRRLMVYHPIASSSYKKKKMDTSREWQERSEIYYEVSHNSSKL